MRIENIEVCQPIVELVKLLVRNNVTIIESRVSDYHFHEVFIRMKNNSFKNFDDINIANITQPNQGMFCCSCHWSCVKVE